MVLTKTPICNFGEKPHSFELKGVNNKLYKLEDCLGQNGTLIMFICNHCPYVKAVIKDIVNDSNELIKLGIKTTAIMSNDTKNYPDDSFEKMMKLKLLLKIMAQYARQIFLAITISWNFSIEVELEN
jgi:hypothetical protein